MRATFDDTVEGTHSFVSASTRQIYNIANIRAKRFTLMIDREAERETAMTFEELQTKALAFRDERDWSQFHNPKDLAISISLESAELLECFQWSGDDLVVASKRTEMVEELSDIFNYCLLMADAIGVDIVQATSDKIDLNAKKYPASLSKGSSAKYTELNE